MKYLVAIGGNALVEKGALGSVSAEIVRLASEGNAVLVTHGNGPQVGMLELAESRPLWVLTAQTQAEIGVQIVESLEEAGARRGSVPIALTRVMVDRRDPEFDRPTKPIGRWYSTAEAKRMEARGTILRRLERGYRHVVPSPVPIGIVEAKEITSLFTTHCIVIAGGGGGIPIASDGKSGKIDHPNAVIDKDRTSGMLADLVGADRLVILTNVDGAYTGFGGRKRKRIGSVSSAEMVRHAERGEFGEGSMKPKVEACIGFVRGGKNRTAVIGDLEHARRTFAMHGCTVIRG